MLDNHVADAFELLILLLSVGELLVFSVSALLKITGGVFFSWRPLHNSLFLADNKSAQWLLHGRHRRRKRGLYLCFVPDTMIWRRMIPRAHSSCLFWIIRAASFMYNHILMTWVSEFCNIWVVGLFIQKTKRAALGLDNSVWFWLSSTRNGICIEHNVLETNLATHPRWHLDIYAFRH